MRAVDDLRAAGATIIDPGVVEGLDQIRRPDGIGPCRGFKYDLNRYLARGSRASQEPRGNREIGPLPSDRATAARAVGAGAGARPGLGRMPGRRHLPAAGARCGDQDDGRAAARCVGLPDVEQSAAAHRRPEHAARRQQPVLLADDWLPGDFRCMGYTRGGLLPAGITFFGRAWSEATLIRLAYAYEQATRHRRPPTSTPPLG